MKKFIQTGVVSVGFLLALSPVFALAQGIDVQSQIAALLAQIKQFQALIAQLQDGQASTSCVDISRNITLGSTGGDVTQLQTYLIAKGYLDARYNTGYYGFITATAVGKLQLSLGIVASADETAYGIMGPRTRAAIGCDGTLPAPTTPNTISPSTGNTAPTCTMYASPASVGIGQAATLYWTSQNATSATGLPTYDANTVPTSGSQAVSIGVPGSSTYAITFTGPGGQTRCSTVIAVSSAPSCTLTTDKATVKPGDTITLSWSSQNAYRADWLAGEQTTLSGTKTKKTDPNMSDYTWAEGLVVQTVGGEQAKCSVSVPISGDPADVTFLSDVSSQAVTLHIRQTATSGLGGIRIKLQSVGTSATGALVANLYITIPGYASTALSLPVGSSTGGGGFGDPLSQGGVRVSVTDLSQQNQTAGISITFVPKG